MNTYYDYDTQVTQLNEFRQNLDILDLDSLVEYPPNNKMDFYMKLPRVISVGSGYWYEMV